MPQGSDAANSSAPAGTQRLVLGVYEHVRSTEMLQKIGPLQRYLEQALGVEGIGAKVELKILPTYGAGVEALADGSVDFSRMGPASYVLAKERNPSIRLLAVESNQGSKRFNGVISVPERSAIHSVEDLRGKTIAFGARNSTTGRYLAQAALIRAGIGAGDLAGYAYLGRHDKVAFAVSAGNYDAGASNENTFNRYAQVKGLRKILEFPSVTKPWVAREGLDEHLFQALRRALLQLKDPQALGPLNRSGFLEAEDGDYDLVREAMVQARVFDDEQLRFGIYAAEKASEVYTRVKPVLDAVERELAADEGGDQFRIKIFASPREGIDALIRGDIDIGRVGAASYVLAKRMNPHIRLLVKEDDGSPTSEGLFVVPADSELSSVSELEGKTIAFGDPYSTAGRFLAQAELLEAGVGASDLQGYVYLGRHDRVAYAVAAGNYDAGALRGRVIEGKAVSERLRVVGRFAVPHKVWVVREGIDEELFVALQQTLLRLGGDESLLPLQIKGFALTDDGAYDGVRESMQRAQGFDQYP